MANVRRTTDESVEAFRQIVALRDTKAKETGKRVRLLAGARDLKFLALAREMAELGCDTELECVPDAGHNLLLEAPEHVARVLTRALEAHP